MANLEGDPSQFSYYEIANVNEILPGQRIYIEVDRTPIVILNIGGLLYAVGDVCTHDNGPVGEGELDGTQIICPRHGARFDLCTGRAVKLPAIKGIPTYPVRVVNDLIEIGFPNQPNK
jgi:3-phenylpropionate/trans-cinnamate dioxygenase ferredoxin subunit